MVVAFDGLQPSQVTPRLMPRLSAFADRGVRFTRHHAVFPSVTRLNAASMVTGCYPGTHGIAGNRFVFRDVDPDRPLDVLEPQLRTVQARTRGRVLLVPTLADILARFGKDYVAVISGTSGNAYCHNPNASRLGGAVLHPDFTLPDDLARAIEASYGRWPAEKVPNDLRVRHATDLLIKYAIHERNAAVAFVWYSEPDKSQHAHGVGAGVANGALTAADAQFGRILDSIDGAGQRQTTDILVVSDHGYSTSLGKIDVVAAARAAGFPELPAAGGVAIAPNGGSFLCYFGSGDRATADRFVAWCATQQWCGALFLSPSLGKIEGTLPGDLLGIDGPRGPDLAVSMAWDLVTPAGSEYAGRSYSAGDIGPGRGDHGSASPQEMRNILIAAGPGFKSGFRSEMPSGNVDIAPTVLSLLGMDAEPMDGRVLTEALSEGRTPKPPGVVLKTYSASRVVEGVRYSQTASIWEVGNTRYLDQAHASREASGW